MVECTMEEISKWEPLAKMESADEKTYEYRIKSAMDVKMQHYKLTPIQFHGEKDEVVEHFYPELVGLCPVTFLPDVYQVHIRYIPDKYIPELKTLKYYLMDYIKLPISHEHVAAKILKQVREQINPKKIAVLLKTNVRGGIYTNCLAGNKELFDGDNGVEVKI